MTARSEAAVTRELTKMHETITRGTLLELAAAFANGEPLKGELVVVIAPPAHLNLSAASPQADDSLHEPGM